MINKAEEIESFDKKKILIKENLSKYSWFNTGGPAEIFFKPDNIDQLVTFLKNNKRNITILGAGSNTLIRDGGVKGVTIKLGSKFSYTNLLSDNIIEVGAATLDKKLSEFAKSNSLTGFEFLSCIPGSIGGAIIMNSGCYGYNISKILYSFLTIDFKGNTKEILAKDIIFSYRSTNLYKNLIIVSAKFKGFFKKKEEIEEEQKKLMDKKKISQPSQIKTGGSTFKNPMNKKAWELIKESECDSLRVGKAKISAKHCNFFVNENFATSQEIEKLINQVKEKVYNKTKVKLELEIKIIGHEKRK